MSGFPSTLLTKSIVVGILSVLTTMAHAKQWTSCASTHVNGKYAVEACATYPYPPTEGQVSFDIVAVGVRNDSTVTVHPYAKRLTYGNQYDRVHDFGSIGADGKSGTVSYAVHFNGNQELIFEFHQGGVVAEIYCTEYGCLSYSPN